MSSLRDHTSLFPRIVSLCRRAEQVCYDAVRLSIRGSEFRPLLYAIFHSPRLKSMERSHHKAKPHAKKVEQHTISQ